MRNYRYKNCQNENKISSNKNRKIQKDAQIGKSIETDEKASNPIPVRNYNYDESKTYQREGKQIRKLNNKEKNKIKNLVKSTKLDRKR